MKSLHPPQHSRCTWKPLHVRESKRHKAGSERLSTLRLKDIPQNEYHRSCVIRKSAKHLVTQPGNRVVLWVSLKTTVSQLTTGILLFSKLIFWSRWGCVWHIDVIPLLGPYYTSLPMSADVTNILFTPCFVCKGSHMIVTAVGRKEPLCFNLIFYHILPTICEYK